jgi:hypothetical protein
MLSEAAPGHRARSGVVQRDEMPAVPGRRRADVARQHAGMPLDQRQRVECDAAKSDNPRWVEQVDQRP